MEPWLIILITISAGLVFFGLVLFLKSRKNKRPRHAAGMSQPVIVVSSGTQNSFIPSTNRSAAYNVRDNQNQSSFVALSYGNGQQGQVFQQPPGQHQMYPGVQQQQQFYPPQPYAQQNQQFQPNMMQNQQLYPATVHRVMAQPTAPAF